MSLQPLVPVILEVEHPVPNNQDIPKNELDIFYRTIECFMPEGKTWDDLTPREKTEVQSKYRFDPMRPGCYQGITGLSKGLNGCP